MYLRFLCDYIYRLFSFDSDCEEKCFYVPLIDQEEMQNLPNALGRDSFEFPRQT